MGRGKRRTGTAAGGSRTAAAAAHSDADPSADSASALLVDLNRQHELLEPLAAACTRLARRRRLDCGEELALLDAGRKFKGDDSFSRLIAVTVLLSGVSDLFEDGLLEEPERADLESALRRVVPDALSFLEGYAPARDVHWLACKTETLMLENVKRFVSLVKTPEVWHLEEALENFDFETHEPYSLDDVLLMLASHFDPRFTDFEAEIEPLLAEARRRVEEQIGPLRKRPLLIVAANKALNKALLDGGYVYEVAALADAASGMITFSVDAAERALELQARAQMDPTLLHELIHLTQSKDDDEDDADHGDEDDDESAESRRVRLGRKALVEGATEALARRLMDSRANGFTPSTERWSAYDVEVALAEALAASRCKEDDERRAMLLRLSNTRPAEMLAWLQQELDRPQLSEKVLETIGWFYEYQYEADHSHNPYYESWLSGQAAKDLLDSLNAGDYDAREPAPALAPPPPSRRRSALAG